MAIFSHLLFCFSLTIYLLINSNENRYHLVIKIALSVIVLYSKNMLRLRPSLGSSRFPARQEMYVSTYSLQNVARTG